MFFIFICVSSCVSSIYILLYSIYFRLYKYKIPDKTIYRSDDIIYLKRWYIIPRNNILNIYLHQFYVSDPDELHDHPWLFNCSILLNGEYNEIVPGDPENWKNKAGTLLKKIKRVPGIPTIRIGPSIHRIELIDSNVWTIFITGPIVRSWYFYCPKNIVDHTDYLDIDENTNRIGKGCN